MKQLSPFELRGTSKEDLATMILQIQSELAKQHRTQCPASDAVWKIKLLCFPIRFFYKVGYFALKITHVFKLQARIY